jgi:hypothetical protein
MSLNTKNKVFELAILQHECYSPNEIENPCQTFFLNANNKELMFLCNKNHESWSRIDKVILNFGCAIPINGKFCYEWRKITKRSPIWSKLPKQLVDEISLYLLVFHFNERVCFRCGDVITKSNEFHSNHIEFNKRRRDIH